MQALRQRFVSQALADADEIAKRAAISEWRAVRDLSHGISGRAGMFGFHTLSEAAGDLEEALDGEEEEQDRRERLTQILLAQLRRLAT